MNERERIQTQLEMDKDRLRHERRLSRQEAWRAYAVAAITGMAASITQDAMEIPVLCRIASEIADEMVKQEAERAQTDGVE